MMITHSKLNLGSFVCRTYRILHHWKVRFRNTIVFIFVLKLLLEFSLWFWFSSKKRIAVWPWRLVYIYLCTKYACSYIQWVSLNTMTFHKEYGLVNIIDILSFMLTYKECELALFIGTAIHVYWLFITRATYGKSEL